MTIRGRVVTPGGAGVALSVVILGRLDPAEVIVTMHRVTTDSDGRYELRVPPGRYSVTIATLLPEFVPPLVERQTPRRDVQQDVDWADIEVRRARPVESVVDEAAAPVADADVRVTASRVDRFETQTRISTKFTTDAQGRFTMPQLDEEERYAIYARTADRACQAPVLVTPGQQREPLKLVVSPAAATRVKGRATDTSGKPVAGAEALVYWSIESVSRFSESAGYSVHIERLKTDDAGWFESPALWPEGQYRAQVQAAGHTRAQTEQESSAAPASIRPRRSGCCRGRWSL